MTPPTKARKAWGALVATLLGGIGTCLLDDGAITRPELGGAVGAALLAAAAVWRIPNPLKDQTNGRRRRRKGMPNDIARELGT